MKLIIDENSAFLGKDHRMFYVRTSGKEKNEFSAKDIDQIIIIRGGGLSIGAIELALKNEIDIVFLDWKGMPIGRVYPTKLGGTTLTRKKQLEASCGKLGMAISKELIRSKISNQGFFLKSLAKTRDNPRIRAIGGRILEETERIGGLAEEKDVRNELLGIEGYAGSLYWEALGELIPVKKREKRGSTDIANSSINYGYGILYSEVEKACLLAGLDPFLGFLHSDRYGKQSMVLDMVEQFRPIVVDRAIVTLFTRKQIEGGILSLGALPKKQRGLIIEEIMKRLNTRISYRGQKTKIRDIILGQAREIAKSVLDQDYQFKGFIYRW